MPAPSTIPFCGFPLDRASALRRDAARVEALLDDPESDLILLSDGRPILAAPAPSGGAPGLLRLAAARRSAVLDARALIVFLGLDAKGRASFAAALPHRAEMDGGPLDGLGAPEDLRAAAAFLEPGELALAGTAKALIDWHARHGFCSACGTRSEPREGGWKRACPSCGAEHFPRTDPVAIMLATRQGQCLLGRGVGFRAGYVSALAGFIEPGETIEEGCARELEEEAGVRMVSARIVANQPWPFPSQLMIGLVAEVDSFDLRIDRDELTDALWFSRAEAAALLSDGGCVKDGATLRAPPPLAIAHHLIRAWLDTPEP